MESLIRLTSAGYVEADGFLGAPGKDVALGQGGSGPAFAVYDLGPGDFFVGGGGGFGDHEAAVVSKGKELAIASEGDVSWAETRFRPLFFTGGQLDAGERAVAVFLESEHTVEMAVVENGSAPVVDYVFVEPNVLGGKFATRLGDFVEAAADTITSRAIDVFSRDNRGGRSGYLEGVLLIPKDFAVGDVHADQAAGHEEDDLPDAVDVGDGGSGMGEGVVPTIPCEGAGIFVESEEGLASTTTSDNDEVAFNDGGGGVLPFDLAAVVIFLNALFPNSFTGLGVEGMEVEVGVVHVNFPLGYGGSGTRAVASAIPFGACIAARMAVVGAGELGVPKLFAGLGIQGKAGFTDKAVFVFFGDKCGRNAICNGKGTESIWRFQFPCGLALELGRVEGFGSGTVETGATVLQPVGSRKLDGSSCRTDREEECFSCHSYVDEGGYVEIGGGFLRKWVDTASPGDRLW